MFVDFMQLQPGDKIRLKNQDVLEVIENIGDGIWINGRVIQSPENPDSLDTELLCHCEEALEQLSNSPVDE